MTIKRNLLAMLAVFLIPGLAWAQSNTLDPDAEPTSGFGPTPIVPGSGWQGDNWYGFGSPFTSDFAPFIFEGEFCVSVTDYLAAGDMIRVYDNGVHIGDTSWVPIYQDPAPWEGDEDAAFANPVFSSGAFGVGPGSHSITLQALQNPFGGASVALRVDECESESRATFDVTKDFNDNNPAEVAVTISCDTGLPLEQTKMISQGDPVEFVVVDFDNGELDCEVTEETPSGYSASYDSITTTSPTSCVFDDVGFMQERACHITNTLQRVEVDVRKIWIDDNPQFNAPNYARARWNCYNSGYQIGADDPAHFGCDGDSCGSLSFYGADDTDSFYVYPDYDGTTWCSVEERVFESGVESSNNCGRLFVSPGIGNACTITNTRFYEGIPTLSQYGLAILALLMLGVGMVGFRRFV